MCRVLSNLVRGGGRGASLALDALRVRALLAQRRQQRCWCTTWNL